MKRFILAVVGAVLLFNVALDSVSLLASVAYDAVTSAIVLGFLWRVLPDSGKAVARPRPPAGEETVPATTSEPGSARP